MKQKFLFRLINKNKNEVIIDFLITVIAYLIIYKYIYRFHTLPNFRFHHILLTQQGFYLVKHFY